LAVAATKQTIRLSADKTVAECYAAVRNGDFPLFTRMMESEDAIEGPNAALEGREPVWKGK
jgi:enoyl-CoA hydratase/carnithine racemase